MSFGFMRNPMVILISLVGLPLFYVFYVLWSAMAWSSPYGMGALDSNSFDDLPYNRREWLEDVSCVDGTNRRGSMVMDIRKRFLHANATDARIEKELGQPFSRHTISSYHDMLARMNHTYFNYLPEEKKAQVRTIFEYYLGEELNEAWGIDRANLYLFFDQNHHYLGCRIGWF